MQNNHPRKHVKNITLLGATGTIGSNTLDVVRHLGPERVHIKGVSAFSNSDHLSRIAREFHCDWAAVSDPDAYRELATRLPDSCQAVNGSHEICHRVAEPDTDLMLCAVLGNAGIHPVLSALKAGKDVALASKEVLVMAGNIVQHEASRNGARILPVDSEHAAIFQCLEGRDTSRIRRIILTASGGPFRHASQQELSAVTVDAALRHPTWAMGRKITIDSATLMNKALEVIEAHWLFGVPSHQIEVLIHPQSIIHSMVEFVDGSILAQLGYPDMRLPIQHALMYPQVEQGTVQPLDFATCGSLTFEQLDNERFPAIDLARHALTVGGTMPTALNAANDVAVEKFCRQQIRFDQIPVLVSTIMKEHDPVHNPSLEDIMRVDTVARTQAHELVDSGRLPKS